MTFRAILPVLRRGAADAPCRCCVAPMRSTSIWVEEDMADDAMQTRPADYLAWHDIAASAKRFVPDRRLVGEILSDEATADGVDLLVMGGYSHSRPREFILGGVTKRMLENGTLPVFVAH